MRVISGAWRGRPLAAPPGRETRPTSERAREGLFSMLASRVGSFEGLRVADLFAGSGALGIEALSRGAAHCLFIENNLAAADAIRANLQRLDAGDRAEIRMQSAQHAAPPPDPCDVVFLDPPWRSGLEAATLEHLARPGWLAPGAWLSLESAGEVALPPGFGVAAERRFGKAVIRLIVRGDLVP